MQLIIADRLSGFAVGHDKAGLIAHSGNVGKELCLRLFIKRTGGFIEQKDRRTAKEGSGNGDALCLALGKAHAAFSQNSFQANVLHQSVYAGSLYRLHDICIRGIVRKHGKVFTQGTGKQCVALRYICKERTGCFSGRDLSFDPAFRKIAGTLFDLF